MHKSVRKKQMFGKRFKKRRAWDCYSYLAIHIINELKAFKKYNVNSYPLEFDSIESWHKIINKMIWSFEEISKDYPNAPKLSSLLDDKEKYNKYRSQIDDGLMLFAKYFENLWD